MNGVIFWLINKRFLRFRRLNGTHILLRGEGSFGHSQSPLTFFQLAEIVEDEEPVSEIKIKASPNGIIDYCPLRIAAEC